MFVKAGDVTFRCSGFIFKSISCHGPSLQEAAGGGCGGVAVMT